MVEVVYDYINEHVYPDLEDYVAWVDAHRHALWVEFKRQHVDEHSVADLVSQVLNEIASQLDYVDELDPWVNEDTLIETLSTLQDLSNDVLEQGALMWLNANRVDLIEAFEEAFVDDFDGEFDDLSDEQRIGEVRASLAEATRLMVHPKGGSRDVAAQHLVRAWVVVQAIENEEFERLVQTQYIQPALNAWFEKQV